MKRLSLLALLILACALYSPVKRLVAPQCLNPKAWYDSDNEVYFDNSLPTDTIVDYSNHQVGVLAVTTYQNGRFHIAFNRDYAASAPVVHLFMLHELCHVQTWNEDAEHGTAWVACMRTLETKGAIDDQMVKPYLESTPSGPSEGGQNGK